MIQLRPLAIVKKSMLNNNEEAIVVNIGGEVSTAFIINKATPVSLEMFYDALAKAQKMEYQIEFKLE